MICLGAMNEHEWTSLSFLSRTGVLFLLPFAFWVCRETGDLSLNRWGSTVQRSLEKSLAQVWRMCRFCFGGSGLQFIVFWYVHPENWQDFPLTIFKPKILAQPIFWRKPLSGSLSKNICWCLQPLLKFRTLIDTNWCIARRPQMIWTERFTIPRMLCFSQNPHELMFFDSERQQFHSSLLSCFASTDVFFSEINFYGFEMAMVVHWYWVPKKIFFGSRDD